MIRHFPNFVCWKEVLELYRKDRDLIFLDGISCYVFGLALGIKGNYFSGPQMAFILKKKTSSNYFLLASDIKTIEDDKKNILPFKESFVGDEELLEFINKAPKGSNIIIGISSPKQNYLANYLYSIRNDLEYFCLGAAVHQTWGFKYANTRLRGSGFQWLEFLLFQPRRTIGKQFQTWSEMLSILVSPSRIKLYKKFVHVSKDTKIYR